jgi:hypothetical protein
MQEGTNNGEDKHLNRERADKYKLSYSIFSILSVIYT